MKYFLGFLIFLTHLSATAQFTDDFEDNDFTNNPTWIGDDSVFTIVDVSGDLQLRSNKLIPSTSFYLSTPSTQVADAQWEFFTKLAFNTSSANYVDVYLVADQSNLLAAGLNGYFVRIGGTTDEISLYKKVAGTATKIIDGIDGTTNVSTNNLKIKVTCSATNEWKLERDISGVGDSYVSEGVITDASVLASNYFGIAVTQSTASFVQKHFFNDIYAGPIIYDLIPPVLLSASAISSTQIDVLFNEPVEQLSAEQTNNYDIQPFQSAATVTLDGSNPALVHITPAFPLSNGNVYTLFTNLIADVYGNISGSQSTQFTYLLAENPIVGDVIINEFVCDESPVVGMPEVEFVEIYNRSAKYFNLDGWKLGDASTFGTIQSGWLSPGEYKVLCKSTNIDTFTMTTAIGVTSFPSFNNSSDDVILMDTGSVILDKISYTDDWYRDEIKKDGGYSIELINPFDPCSGSDNWIASNDPSGGTPGFVNSVWDVTPDTENPEIVDVVAYSPNLVQVYFSEGMDSTSLANSIISTNPALTIQNIVIADPFPSMFQLFFNENLAGSQTYSLTLQNISDCWLNDTSLTSTFALAENASIGNVIINEIMFDPITGGSDWIEVYNKSNKLIDLINWQLANFDNDTISNNKVVSQHFYLEPGGYAVIGKDSNFVKQNYPAAVTGTFVYGETPSFNIDSGTVYLIYDDEIMDKVSYAEEWHFKLLDDSKGVSLERIDPDGISSDQNNWHSAAEAIGFATPGDKNSQYLPAITNGEFSFTSQTISPDNDGFEDFLQVNYEMIEAGLLGKFTIYDDRGRLIRTLFSNEILSTSGTFNWDGVSDENVKASIGTYIAVFEAFSIDGAILFTQKKVFVVAGKL